VTDDDVPPLRVGTRPRPPTVLGSVVAGPLAPLLDVLTGQVERDERGVDPEAARAAVAVAWSVLRSCATPPVDAAGDPRPADPSATAPISCISARPQAPLPHAAARPSDHCGRLGGLIPEYLHVA
jgi:hypothetical protein